MEEYLVGRVLKYLKNKKVAVILLESDLEKQPLHIRGKNTDFEIDDYTLQIEGEEVEKAAAGVEIGIAVPEPVAEGDEVMVTQGS